MRLTRTPARPHSFIVSPRPPLPQRTMADFREYFASVPHAQRPLLTILASLAALAGGAAAAAAAAELQRGDLTADEDARARLCGVLIWGSHAAQHVLQLPNLTVYRTALQFVWECAGGFGEGRRYAATQTLLFIEKQATYMSAEFQLLKSACRAAAVLCLAQRRCVCRGAPAQHARALRSQRLASLAPSPLFAATRRCHGPNWRVR